MKHLIPRTHHNFAIAVDNDTNFRNIFGQTVRHQIKSYFRRLLNLRQQAEVSVIGILQRQNPYASAGTQNFNNRKIGVGGKANAGRTRHNIFHTFK